MTTGQQEQKTEGKGVTAGSPDATGVPSASPAGKEKPSSDDQRVPYDRFEKVSKENKTLKSELDSMKSELAKLREDRGIEAALNALKSDRPKGFDEWSEDDRTAFMAHRAAQNAIPEDLKQIAREYVLDRHVAEAAPELNRKQAMAVVKILAKVGVDKIEVEEAVALAARRDPDLFPQAEPEKPKKGDKNSFKVQNPSGERESGAESDKRLKEIDAALMNPMLSNRDRIALRTEQRSLRSKQAGR